MIKFLEWSFRKIIREIDNSIIQDVKTFDVYEGENIPKDKKSVAISVTLQSLNKTLSEQDLDQCSKRIVEVVKEENRRYNQVIMTDIKRIRNFSIVRIDHGKSILQIE